MPKINIVWPLADSKQATLISPNLVGYHSSGPLLSQFKLIRYMRQWKSPPNRSSATLWRRVRWVLRSEAVPNSFHTSTEPIPHEDAGLWS
jgi:hypothetical protein